MRERSETIEDAIEDQNYKRAEIKDRMFVYLTRAPGAVVWAKDIAVVIDVPVKAAFCNDKHTYPVLCWDEAPIQQSEIRTRGHRTMRE